MLLTDTEKMSLELLKTVLDTNNQTVFNTLSENYIDIFQELQQHAVSSLVAPCFSRIKNIPDNIVSEWEKVTLQQIYLYTQYLNIQREIEISFKKNNIPFIILKGTSASCYYPYPQLRAMGDIDIITSPENIDKAGSVLEEIGYKRLYLKNDFGRTVKYLKGNMEVEIHNYYASLNDPEKAEYLDNLILENINSCETKLPDRINGLVLLEHIGDHLEHGLGLRQIIDWMMYVRKCLSDVEWEAWFKQSADRLGLNTLAITVTRMCQIYLGLCDNITWCKTADDLLCRELMAYIMRSGNFGRKIDIQKRSTITVFTNHRSIIEMFQLLQRYGETNWKLLKKYSFLRPLSWLYEISHLVSKRIGHDYTLSETVEEYREGRERKALFEKLGVKQYKKGLAVRKGDHFVVDK